MKISVIIPVYNAEAYIEMCVKSIVEFMSVNGLDFEVIMVDDGSKDNSLAKIKDIESWVKGEGKDAIVVHQENQGVSAARNNGFVHATGDFVWFVDADDYVQACNLDAVTLASLNDANFVVTGFVWDENGDAKSFGATAGEIPYNLWRCWFRREAIVKCSLKFTVGRKYAEDQEFILMFLLKTGTSNMAAIDAPLYYYTLRPGSAMTRKGVKLKKVWDSAAVLARFKFAAVGKGKIFVGWVLHELVRMTKSLFVTIIR